MAFGIYSSLLVLIHRYSEKVGETTYITRIPSMIIKCLRSPLCGINTNPRIPSNKKIPLIARGMPMNLSCSVGLHRDDRRANHARNGEYCGVDDLYAATGDYNRIVRFGSMVGIGLGLRDDATRADDCLLLDICGGGCTGEDEELGWWDILPG
jgi:hypothetical protein